MNRRSICCWRSLMMMLEMLNFSEESGLQAAIDHGTGARDWRSATGIANPRANPHLPLLLATLLTGEIKSYLLIQTMNEGGIYSEDVVNMNRRSICCWRSLMMPEMPNFSEESGLQIEAILHFILD